MASSRTSPSQGSVSPVTALQARPPWTLQQPARGLVRVVFLSVSKPNISSYIFTRKPGS